MIRTVVALHGVDHGLRPDRVLTLRVPLPPARYPDGARRAQFFEELTPRLAALPGVAAVGVNTSAHPMGNLAAAVEIDAVPGQNTRPVLVHQVNDGYLAALGIDVRRGRPLEPVDVRDRRRVALVNETFARARLEGREPLGVQVRIPRLQQPPFSVADPSFEIVGVVEDTLNEGLDEDVAPELYVPYTLAGIAQRMVLATTVDPNSLARSVAQQVYALDRDQPVMEVRTLEAVMQESMLAGPRFNLVLFGVFAALGLALAVVGVYGVVSAAVEQQRHELGVRIALGAGTGRIAAMVMGRGARLLLAGIAAGLVAGLLATRVMAAQIWNVSTFDPLSFATVSVLLLVAGLQACYWPARRAARVDPIVALREE